MTNDENPTPIVGGAVSATGNQGAVPSPAENAATVRDALDDYHGYVASDPTEPDKEAYDALAALLAQAEAGATNENKWGDLQRAAERIEAAESERDAAVRAAEEWRSQLANEFGLTEQQRARAERAEREAEHAQAALREKDGQPILNAARRLLLATDDAERNAALGDLHNAIVARAALTGEGTE